LNAAIETTKEELGSEKFISLLIGNKSDLSQQREVTYDQGFELKKKYGLNYFTETNHFIEEETPNIIRKLDELLNINDIPLEREASSTET